MTPQERIREVVLEVLRSEPQRTARRHVELAEGRSSFLDSVREHPGSSSIGIIRQRMPEPPIPTPDDLRMSVSGLSLSHQASLAQLTSGVDWSSCTPLCTVSGEKFHLT